MSSGRRSLRSTQGPTAPTSSPGIVTVTVTSTVSFAASPSLSQSMSSSHEAVQIVPPGSKLSGLTTVELRLLREKQARLASTALSTLASLPLTHSRNALEASLIFAQYEAGSAVCIDPAGWLLTCAHCFGDTEEEWKASDRRKWLLFYTGLAVQVQCQVWDSKRDLALLKIIAVESSRGNDGAIPTFRFVPLSALALVPTRTRQFSVSASQAGTTSSPRPTEKRSTTSLKCPMESSAAWYPATRTITRK
jgi:hypothetical protein